MFSRKRVIGILIVLLLLIGCSGRELVLQPEQEHDRNYYARKLVYTDTLKKFVQAQVKYNIHYEAADQETRKFLRDEVDPLWLQASTALDVWNSIIESRLPDDDAMADFKAIKTQILLKLPDLIW